MMIVLCICAGFQFRGLKGTARGSSGVAWEPSPVEVVLFERGLWLCSGSWIDAAQITVWFEIVVKTSILTT